MRSYISINPTNCAGIHLFAILSSNHSSFLLYLLFKNACMVLKLCNLINILMIDDIVPSF